MAMVKEGTSPATVLANHAQETRIVINDYPADKSLPPWPPTKIGVHDYYRRPRLLWSSSMIGVVFCTQWKRHPINRPGVADLQAGCAATWRLEMRLHLAQINKPINGRKRPAGAPPRGYVTFQKRTREVLWNQQIDAKTNLNEPKRTQRNLDMNFNGCRKPFRINGSIEGCKKRT
jgi:hypothetical protein